MQCIGLAQCIRMCNVTTNLKTNNSDFGTVKMQLEVQENNIEGFFVQTRNLRRTGEKGKDIGHWYGHSEVLTSDFDDDNAQLRDL